LADQNSSSNAGIQPIVWLAAVLTCLAGCRTFEPSPVDPQDSMVSFESRTLEDESLRDQIAGRLEDDSPTWPRESWDLEALTLAAFHFQPELAEASARWSRVRAGVVTAGQHPNPSVALRPSLNSSTSIPTPWIVTANFSVPIETAGKRGKRIALAERQIEAATLEVSRTAWAVRARLRSALVALWAADDLANALTAQEAAQKEVVRLPEARYEAGLIGRTRISRERIAMEQIRAASIEARSALMPAKDRLAAAIGVPGRALEGINLALDEFSETDVKIPDDAARRRALLNRSDVLGGLADYAVAEASLQLEVARQYPDLNLNPGYNFDQGDNEWRLGLSVDLPVLNQNQGPIAEAEARRREAAARFATIQSRAIAEVNIALAAHRAAREIHSAATRALEPADRQTQLTEARFAAGQASRLDAARAKVERAAAKTAVVRARRATQEALGDLEAALQIPAKAMRAGPVVAAEVE
jgi:cobalt-zinc-cadmium efflux system outer membrane protein